MAKEAHVYGNNGVTSITHSVLGILPMGPNPGGWPYGTVAVLDEPHGISNHHITTLISYVGVMGTKTVVIEIYST